MIGPLGSGIQDDKVVKTPHRKTRIDGGELNIVITNRRGITDRSLNVSVR
jgi:hypothetical protein